MADSGCSTHRHIVDINVSFSGHYLPLPVELLRFFYKGGTKVARKDIMKFVLVIKKVTTCLENLEMSGNLEHVREMSVKKSCHGKVSQNCSLLDEY